ncbi:hypothetical protein BH09GEM1_BH09GEM1_06390 [soil metagenome]
MWRSAAVAVLWLGFAVGCASGGKPQALRAAQLGAYRFTERVADDVTLEGIFVIEPDTVSIEATPGPCRYESERSNSLGYSYTCGDVHYAFERSDPLRTASYSVVVHLRETKSVCVRYTVTSTGRQVCAESRNETVFRDVRRSGLLRPQRVDPEAP